MPSVELLAKALDSAIFELGEAFKELPDADVWKRPDPRLLSVGEIAAHIGHWLARSFFGENFSSPLVTDAAQYYKSNVDKPFQLDLDAEEIFAEIKRIHEACKASIAANPPDSDAPNPHREGWTWGYVLEYQAFHIAYHTGQIYSVRHLLGHETVDN